MSAPAQRGTKFPLRLDQLTPGSKRLVAAAEKGQAQLTSKASARPVTPLAGANLPVHARASGLGMDSSDVRNQMVRRLRAAGLESSDVLTAMSTVPRHLFVDTALVTQAYEDTSLPIGHGQTISKPSVVARMIELLMAGTNANRLKGLGNVLEIGTGCGYQAAVLSLLAQNVVSVERLKPLHDKARELLASMRSNRLRLVYGDGMLGHPPNAPYDSVIAAAGGEALPPAWLEQLAVGGRMVSPVHQPASGRQMLVVVDRTEHGYEHHVHEAVNFVPLKSGMVG